VPLVNSSRFLPELIILAGILVPAFISTAVRAEWTGISMNIEDYSTTWQFRTLQRTTDINQWNFNLEEKTTSALRVGLSIGQSRIRISDNISPTNTQKFDANSLGLYLRLPLSLSDNFSVQGRLSYRINSGSDSKDIDPSEIEWYETEVELGLSGRWQSVRLTPFVAYRNINGDITDSSGIELFDPVDEISSGIRFDYYIDPTAYIRFQLTIGANEGGYLVFAREY
jgi:hypothetical protein